MAGRVRRVRLPLAAGGFGGAFGFVLAWSRLSDPDVIRSALLLEEAYLYLLMATAVPVGFVGARLLRRARARALLTGERVSWTTTRPDRGHVTGSIIFGAGWAVSASCPGPIAAQLGQGVYWSLFTMLGIVFGIRLYLWRHESLASRRSRASVPSPAAGKA
jgi:uncharacterized membrane protein YedE/YeeE